MNHFEPILRRPTRRNPSFRRQREPFLCWNGPRSRILPSYRMYGNRKRRWVRNFMSLLLQFADDASLKSCKCIVFILYRLFLELVNKKYKKCPISFIILTFVVQVVIKKKEVLMKSSVQRSRIWGLFCALLSFYVLLTRKKPTVNHSWADTIAYGHQSGTPLLYTDHIKTDNTGHHRHYPPWRVRSLIQISQRHFFYAVLHISPWFLASFLLDILHPKYSRILRKDKRS